MHISHDTSKWYDSVWAAFIFFTRLPLWRIYQPPKEAYATVVEFWPLTGWLTGGVTAGTLLLVSEIAPLQIAAVLAIAVRLLVTGALHEDGLADFADGFGGGGHDRSRILAIMKDSRIGTYGVTMLIMYFTLLFFSLISMTPQEAAMTIAAADPYSKMLTAQLVQMMPYARNEETAKNHTVYRKFGIWAGISLFLQGLLPLGCYSWYMAGRMDWQMLVFVPAAAMYFLYLFVWRRLRGYTGDCCGAVCLLTELATILTAVIYIGR